MITVICILIIVFILIDKREKEGKPISSIEKDIKDVGDKIVDSIKSFATTPVSKCPSCGAHVSDDKQKNCSYCGCRLPRKNKFK